MKSYGASFSATAEPSIDWPRLKQIGRAEIERPGAVPFENVGLRLFRAPDKTLALFYSGGYRLKFREGTKSYQVVGPGFLTGNFFVIDPNLSARPDLR